MRPGLLDDGSHDAAAPARGRVGHVRPGLDDGSHDAAALARGRGRSSVARPGLQATAWVAGLVCLACGADTTRSAEPPKTQPESQARAPASAEIGPRRVLVTGFHDWRELGDPPNIWRCRDNPSCRVLAGEGAARPERFAGPLARRLRQHAQDASGRALTWSFATMPVTWGAFDELGVTGQFDVVIHLGLGIYDRDDVLQLEDGAYNLRRGQDARGHEPPSERPGAADADTLRAPQTSEVAATIERLAGQQHAGYKVVVKAARPGNAYLCNETHFLALTALGASARDGGRLQAAYFVHIPYARGGDFEALAAGLEGVIVELVSGPASGNAASPA